MVTVITKSGIKLPYTGKEKFVELMRLGLKYDRETRTFYIENVTYAIQLKAVLEELLKDKIVFGQKCVVCDRIFSCEKCDFINICKSTVIPSYCVCNDCASKNFFPIYLKKVETILNV